MGYSAASRRPSDGGLGLVEDVGVGEIGLVENDGVAEIVLIEHVRWAESG